MIHGKWRVHTLCTPINTKWRIRSSSNSHASHTTHKGTPMRTNIFVRIDDVIPLFMEPTRHRWFPLTMGNWCGGFDIRQLFAWTNCWTNIRVAGSRRYRSHFHYWNFDRLSYSFKLEQWFIYQGAYLHFLCMQADGQTDGQGATDNEYTSTPIPWGKRYSHRYKWYLVLVYWKFIFFEKKITIREPVGPTIVFRNLR